MQAFRDRFKNSIIEVLTGFDRIVFKGMFRPLVYVDGVRNFLGQNSVTNKGYKEWMLTQTKKLLRSIETYAAEHNQKVIHLRSWRERKEKIAHEHQKKHDIKNGLIGIWSCLEAGKTYRAYYDPGAGKPCLHHYSVPCKHCYFYFDHEDYGFMNVRLQTWFPYHIQIAMNGREWLRRSLEKEKINFICDGNKFLHIDDYRQAQRMLDQQLEQRWRTILNSFLPIVFPTMHQTLGPQMAYYWTLWQSEWASDFIFRTPQELEPIMHRLRQHAFLSGTSERIINYMGHPLKKNGQPGLRFPHDVISRISEFHDAARVRHWVGKNSVKVYNEHNVLRVETTINDPAAFKVRRHATGEAANAEKKLRRLRKGIVDIPLRAKVSQDVNKRFITNLALVNDQDPINPLLQKVTTRFKKNARSVRALDLLGKDYDFFKSLNDPTIEINGTSNKEIRATLKDTSWGKGKTDKQLSAKVSRQIRLLRDHGLLRKQPCRNRYNLTPNGRKIILAVTVIPACSTDKLMEIAA